MRIEVLNRLVLAKQLLMAAEAACSVANDQWAFTRGIILLHDAAESALGAIADHLHAIKDAQKNIFLLGYCELIEKADPQNASGNQTRRVPYQQQLRVLNTLRNNAKHSGILPDQKANNHFPSTISAFISDICQAYLGITFADICLTSLIRNDSIRGYIEEAEAQFERREYEEALVSLSYAMFYIVDSEAVPWSVFDNFFRRNETTPQKKYVFPDFYNVSHRVRLLERGVDLHLHSNFHLLTPKVGRETEGGSPVFRWDKRYGHPGNWTEKNVRFCLNFCIETALKFQRDDAHEYEIVHYSSMYEDVIEPVNEEVTIWNISNNTSDYYPRPEQYERKPVLILRAGETLVGEVSDQENKLHEWWVMFRAQLDGKPEEIHHGYVAKDEVKITRREILR